MNKRFSQGTHVGSNKIQKITQIDEADGDGFDVASVQLGTIVSKNSSNYVAQWESNTSTKENRFIIQGETKKSFTVLFGVSNCEFKINFQLEANQHFKVERDGAYGSLVLRFRNQQPLVVWRKNQRANGDKEWWVVTTDPSGENNVFFRCRDYRIQLTKTSESREDELFWMLRQSWLMERSASILLATVVHVRSSTEVATAIVKWTQYFHDMLPFQVRFSVEMVFAHFRLDPVAFFLVGDGGLMVTFLEELQGEDAATVCFVLQKMLVDSQLTSEHKLMEVWQHVHKSHGGRILNDPAPLHNKAGVRVDRARINRLYVTPLGLCPQPATMDGSSRVIRYLAPFVHRLLRVSLTDTFFKPINNRDPKDTHERCVQIVKEGVVIAGRHFKILGYSNSQAKELKFMFYDEAPGHPDDLGATAPTIAAIRSWIGDLSHIRKVGLNGARHALAFSDSSDSFPVHACEIVTMSDVEVTGLDGVKYNFSDGCGLISKSFARSINEMMRYPKGTSVFQIHLDGYKGVLSVAPEGHELFRDPTIKIALRPSMKKFDAPQSKHMLEILSYGKALPLYLNLQLIPILIAMGLSESYIFHKLMPDMLKNLEEASTPRGKQAAIDVLSLFGPESLNDADDSSEFRKNARALDMLTKTNKKVCDFPLVQEVLSSIRGRVHRGLASKGRVFVPDAVCLLGVMDETGSLAEDEVCVRFTHRLTGQPVSHCFASQTSTLELKDQDVIVGRNPSMHPGDVRKVRAVQVDALSHLTNVIVFPRRGARPQPNMMSGGDLDGDLFFVIYDEKIVEGCTHQFPAADFTPSKGSPQETTSPNGVVTVEETGLFLLEYNLRNNLGLIATLHVAMVDKHGVDAERCKDLANLHSVAVDSAKSGLFATLPREWLQNQKYPHFMMKSTENTRSNGYYESFTCLGQMCTKVVTKYIPFWNGEE